MKYQTTVQKSDFNHDPKGPEVQVHELEDGGAILTFSDSLMDQLNWKIGDVIEWDLTDSVVSIVNKSTQIPKKEDTELP